MNMEPREYFRSKTKRLTGHGQAGSSGSIGILKELLGVIARIFWGPDEAFCANLREDAFWESLETRLAQAGAECPALIKGLRTYATGFENPEQLYIELESEYIRLFINSADGIVAPLYQSCYEGSERLLMRNSAIEMSRRLENSGLSLSPEVADLPDHLCIELEYLYYLLSQKSTASKNNDEAKAFLVSVLLPWVTKFVRTLDRDQKDVFYSSWSQLLMVVSKTIERYLASEEKLASTFQVSAGKI